MICVISDYNLEWKKKKKHLFTFDVSRDLLTFTVLALQLQQNRREGIYL